MRTTEKKPNEPTVTAQADGGTLITAINHFPIGSLRIDKGGITVIALKEPVFTLSEVCEAMVLYSGEPSSEEFMKALVAKMEAILMGTAL